MGLTAYLLPNLLSHPVNHWLSLSCFFCYIYIKSNQLKENENENEKKGTWEKDDEKKRQEKNIAKKKIELN
jgi:hypothetical protein